jgi:hypothetical protein
LDVVARRALFPTKQPPTREETASFLAETRTIIFAVAIVFQE